MLEGKPTIVLSYSVGYRDTVAGPVAERLAPHGFRVVLVAEEPLPPGIDSNPNDKVEWYFRQAQMAVFLATPDDRLQTGEVHTRPNIIDEHRLAQQLPHLQHNVLVFKAAEVTLPSNINPAYERLPVDDPDWIVEKIVDQARIWGALPAAEASEPERSPQSSEEAPANTTVLADADSKAAEQAVASLERTIATLRGETADLPAFRRAELAVAALMADAGGGADTLGVHAANGVFVQRHDLQLRPDERRLLFRTYLRHSRDDNVPGFAWLRGMHRRDILGLLTAFTQHDPDEEVRAQSLLILARLRVPNEAGEVRALLRPLLESDESRLRRAAIDYVLERRDYRLRDVLDDPRLLEQERYYASKAAALLDLPGRPGKVMERYIDDVYVRDRTVAAQLLASANRISRRVVATAIHSGVRDVRRLGLRLAAEKRCLSSALGREIIHADKSPSIRLEVVRSLLRSGQPVDFDLVDHAARKRDGDATDLPTFAEERELEVELANLVPLKELEAAVVWSVLGASLYKVLGLRDADWTDRYVRRDLGADFMRLQTDWRNNIVARLVAAATAKAERELSPSEHDSLVKACEQEVSQWDSDGELREFLVRMFRRAALHVLAVRGRPSDVRFAREFADDADQDIRVEAIRLLDRFGTRHDASTLLNLVDRVYEDADRVRAAGAALRLAYKKDKLDVLSKLRETRATRAWSVERLADVQGGVHVAWALVMSEDADVRVAAANVVWDAIPSEKADALLSFYTRGRHYYNVVRAVDERLYAPGWLREALDQQPAT